MNQKSLFLIALTLFLFACQSEDIQSQVEACAEVSPLDTAALTGEKDPIAQMQAQAGCGTVNLWGASFPKTMNYWTDPNSFSAQIMGLMFEPLLSLHSTEDRPVGILAESWESNDANDEFTFKIDSRARWSDGQPVSAYDVQFYYDVIMKPEHLTPIFKTELQRFDRPEVLDSLTVRIKAKKPHWNNFWAAAGMMAFPQHAWDSLDFNQVRFEFPVVSGPYAQGELAKNRYLDLVRRDDWWGRSKAWNLGKYNFQKLRYKFMEDRTKALEALKKGDFDIYAIYTSSIWMRQTDFPAVQNNWVLKQKVYNREPIGFQGFSINMRRPKFQDVRVRQALSMLLDREVMNEKYMYNQYFLLNSYYPDLFTDNISPHNPTYSYQPDSARALLAAAGYEPNAQGMLHKNGDPLQITFITQTVDLRHFTKYVEDLRAVGIDARIEQMSWPSLVQRMEEFDYDLYWVNWGAGRLRDPEFQWSSAGANTNGSNNYAGVNDAVVDSLIELQKLETDLERRTEILLALDKRLAEIVPYVLLWQADHTRLLYWNRFGTPPYILDKFGREESAVTYWWYDTAKAQALRAAQKSGGKLEAVPFEVNWED